MLDTITFIAGSMPILMKGAWMAILITLLAVFFGVTIGIIVAFFRIYGAKPIQKVLYIYEWVLRGTPILVILFILYFGFPEIGFFLYNFCRDQFGWNAEWVRSIFNLDPFIAIVLGLALRSSAYQAQIYRSAILSIGTQQMEAGLSIGLSRVQTMYHIILPQAVRLSFPGFTNEFTIILKDSSLAYAVGIAEILSYSRSIMVNTGRAFEILFACALLYFILFEISFYILNKVNQKFQIPGFTSDIH